MTKNGLSAKVLALLEEHSVRIPEELSASVVGSKLIPWIDVWEPIALKLNISIQQACDFTESAFTELDLTLYAESKITGLWRPFRGVSAHGHNKAKDSLVDLWGCAASNGWDLSKLTEWRCLRVAPEARDAIIDSVERILNATPDCQTHALVNSTTMGSPVESGEGPSLAEIDPADLPTELSAANIAHRAVSNGFGDKEATFKNRLIAYLEASFPDLTAEAVKRISTVANPDKAPGRRKSGVE